MHVLMGRFYEFLAPKNLGYRKQASCDQNMVVTENFQKAFYYLHFEFVCFIISKIT